MDELAAAILYAKTAPDEDPFVAEEHESYDIETLHEKYRARLYSEKALSLLKTPKE